MEETENNLIIQEIHPIFSKKRSQEKVEKRNGDGMHRDGSGLLDVVVNRGLLEEVVVDPSPEATSMRGRKQPQLPRWSQHPGRERRPQAKMARRKRKWQISTESCVHSLMLSLIRTLSPETVAKCLVTILQSGLVQVSRSAPCVCWSEVVSLTYLKISAGSWLSYVLPAKVSVQDGDKIPRI